MKQIGEQRTEIRQYIEQGSRIPAGQIRRNRWVYRGYGWAAVAVGGVAAVMVGGVGGLGLRWLWRSYDLSELAEQLAGLGLVMGMILVGRAVGMAVWARLRSRFVRREMRPLVVIRPEAGDPYIGRVFLDREGRVAMVYDVGPDLPDIQFEGGHSSTRISVSTRRNGERGFSGGTGR